MVVILTMEDAIYSPVHPPTATTTEQESAAATPTNIDNTRLSLSRRRFSTSMMESEESAASSATPPPSQTLLMDTPISLHVREATPSKDDDNNQLPLLDEDEDLDADDESSSATSAAAYPRMRYPAVAALRERSHSTILSPPHLSSSHLDIGPSAMGSSMAEPKTKRSVSTCGPLSISPPTKSLRGDDDGGADEDHALSALHRGQTEPLTSSA